MTRNMLNILVGILVLVIVVIGYLYYEETRARSGVEIKIDEHGVTMEEK